ncbi:MAG: lactate dehydrogenase, partial [Burkholderiales bacterium]|nr:lactate dehydrogenase [Burkholderiales bacterium]
GKKFIYFNDQKKEVTNINAYLVDGANIIVEKHSSPISDLPAMVTGNIPRDKKNFMLSSSEKEAIVMSYPASIKLIRKILGSKEFINGVDRYCLWISDEDLSLANSIAPINERLQRIREYRETGSERGKLGIDTPHKFERTIIGLDHQIIIPRVSSERREYIPIGLLERDIIISDAAQAIYDSPLYVFSVICSKLHIAWISVTAGRMKSDFRYSSGVCYNSFPLPSLTEKNKADLTRCTEDILLAREAHFPATIADLYDPDNMPENLRHAHERNDEVLERIYIGRRFKNDTERLKKLFELYTKITGEQKTADLRTTKTAKS